GVGAGDEAVIRVGEGRLCRPEPVAGGFGNPVRVPEIMAVAGVAAAAVAAAVFVAVGVAVARRAAPVAVDHFDRVGFLGGGDHLGDAFDLTRSGGGRCARLLDGRGLLLDELRRQVQ